MPSTRCRRFLPVALPEPIANASSAAQAAPAAEEDEQYVITDGPFAETKEVMLAG
jgi:hypothetical protein